MKILVTGFDPFGQEKVNPASEAVMSLRWNGSGLIVMITASVTMRGINPRIVRLSLLDQMPILSIFQLVR